MFWLMNWGRNPCWSKKTFQENISVGMLLACVTTVCDTRQWVQSVTRLYKMKTTEMTWCFTYTLIQPWVCDIFGCITKLLRNAFSIYHFSFTLCAAANRAMRSDVSSPTGISWDMRTKVYREILAGVKTNAMSDWDQSNINLNNFFQDTV